MANPEELSSAERLKRHFSSRVLNQARQLIDVWQLINESEWTTESYRDLVLNSERLLRNAQRFNAVQHKEIAHQMLTLLATTNSNEAPSSLQKAQLNELILKLSRTSLRRSDELLEELPSLSQQPIYLALNDRQNTDLLINQMQSFRLYPKRAESAAALMSLINKRQPAALVMDIDFTGSTQGLALAEQLQQTISQPIPIVFTYNENKPDLATQLRMMRANSIGLYINTDIHAVISKLEQVLDINPKPAYSVLIVDDSRAQALFTANILEKADIKCETVNDPLQVFDALTRFDPDLILMDMYMPGCTGVELARVIRQQREYINLPIIYLSGEEDRQRQLDAMAKAGDDFLTKPVEASHLLTTINNRIARAKQLQNLIARDSLTGLLNHTHTLAALQTAMNRHSDTPITFVMLDIDHFKQINDTYGHPLGDTVIRNLALYLRQHLRRSDPIGRYGGEEFAAVLIGANEGQALSIMDSIRAGFAELVQDNNTLKVTFSCGLAQWHGESASELVSLADQALYLAKHQGRNQVATASQLKKTPT